MGASVMTRWSQAVVDAALADMPFASTGPCPGCAECASDYGMEQEEFDAQYEDGRICAEPSFSWSACDVCGSRLGGDREVVHYSTGDGAVNHVSPGACVDCILYMANGDLPEGAENGDEHGE